MNKFELERLHEQVQVEIPESRLQELSMDIVGKVDTIDNRPLEIHAINSESKTPNPNYHNFGQRKPILEAIREMYNRSGKTSHFNEGTEFEINDNYVHSHQDYQDLKKRMNRRFNNTRKIMIKDMMQNTNKRQEILNQMDRIIGH